MSRPLIIKCNRMFPDSIIEEYRQVIIKQMREDEVVVLPPGFELAEVNVELLEQIKAEIQGLIDFEESCCGNTTLGYECLGVIEDRISKLKGETTNPKGVLEQIAEEQKTLLDTTKAWSKALEHGDIY